MNKKSFILLGISLIFILILSGCVWKGKSTNQNQAVQNTNQIINQRQDIKNGFSIIVPSGWISGDELKDAINTIKFGSPAQIQTFYQKETVDTYGAPFISTQTFTIDQRLSARDVVNLIQDSKIANKLAKGTKECFFNPQEFSLAGFSAYSYIHDNTDLSRCEEYATESGISESVVLKNPGDEHTLMLGFGSRTQEEYDKLLPDFQKVLDSVKYENKELI